MILSSLFSKSSKNVVDLSKLDAEKKLELLFKNYVVNEDYRSIDNILSEIERREVYPVNSFDRHFINNVKTMLDEKLDKYNLPDFVLAAVIGYISNKDPNYFNFILKEGYTNREVRDVFEELIEGGLSNRAYETLEAFIDQSLSQISEFMELVNYIDEHGFKQYKKVIDELGNVNREDIILYGMGYEANFDKKEFIKMRDYLQKRLLPNFAKIIAGKGKLYLLKATGSHDR